MHRQGYNATGVKDIVEAAGIPKGSFYNYFESKEQFAVEALNFVNTVGFETFCRMLADQTLPPLARLAQAYDVYIEHYSSLKFMTGCIVGNLCQEMADQSAAIGHMTNKIFCQNAEPLRQCLREAQAAGELGADRDIDRLAEFMINSWSGAVMRMKASRSKQPLTTFREVVFTYVLRPD